MTMASRLQSLADVVLISIVFIVVRTVLSHMGAPKPGSIAVVICLVVATLRLRQYEFGWEKLGFALPDSWAFTILLAAVAYFVTTLIIGLVTDPLADLLKLPPSAFHKLGELSGNLPYLLFMIVAIGWGAAAFGEELLFRGFVLNRLQATFGGGSYALALAVLAQALLFALGHIYLGWRGVMNAGTVGLVFGTFYAVSGGSLWPLIIAHGLIDTISMYALYAGIAQP